MLRVEMESELAVALRSPLFQPGFVLAACAKRFHVAVLCPDTFHVELKEAELELAGAGHAAR